MTTTERILNLMNQKKVTAAQITKELQLNHSAIDNWKSGKAKPSAEALAKLAKYFNVTVDYLLGITDFPTPPPDNLNGYSKKEMHTFQVIGAICAGYEGENEFNPTDEEITVPVTLLKTHNPEDYFVLRVKGESMFPLFMDGDKVLVQKNDLPNSGVVAAVGFDGEDATLKKIEYGDGWMKLIPRNPEYPEKVIKGEDLNQCRIYGEVVYKFSDNVRF